MSRRPYVSRAGRALFAVLVAALAVAAPHGGVQPQAPQATSPTDPYPNFDIRDFKTDPRLADNAGIAAYMETLGAMPAAAADALAGSRDAVASLQAELPGVRVQDDAPGGLGVVSAMPGTPMLAEGTDSRVATLRGFLRGHAAAYGLMDGQADEFVVVADAMNPAGNMAWVELEQRLNGIPVFQGYLRGAFTAKGDLARTNGRLATGVAAAALDAAPSISAAQAIALAAANVGLPASEQSLVAQGTVNGHQVFARGAMAAAPEAWLVYFPIAHGVARLAWATQVFGDPLSFMTVVDAETGTLLFRKGLTEFQTQAATYNVYTSDSPAPSSPSPALPGANYTAPLVPRTSITVIGNEAPNTFNNLGWITDGANGGNGLTDGNNVEAGVDLVAPDGVDATVPGAARVFNFAYNPGPGSPAPGDAPTLPAYRNGEVTNMFYWVNRYHDDTYRLGFTEQFRNFQNDNFGRGGVAADRVSAETQDSSGTNNANFSTPADGGRGRMQMYVWSGPTPDRSGGLDVEIMIHELTHGLSNRLHANSSGLSTNMSRGLGEGWSDFYARVLLSDASEDVNGNYSMGGWATDELVAGYESYYYGIRRFPYAVKTSLGINGRPHNPMTFADIDQTQANLTDGAYPAATAAGSSNRDQVHEQGQIWAMMLLEIRARFITRLGFAAGNQRILQFVTDGMKGDPVGPTFLTARDSIIAAANAGGGTAADITDIWAGFATRGLGTTASIQNPGTGLGDARVTESFLRPGDPTPTFTINDVTAAEGNAGTTNFVFTVSLANPSTGTATVVYSTANGTATSNSGSPVGTSTGAVTLPAGAPGTTSGPAGPYPKALAVAGVPGTITSLAVRLDGLTHTFPGDLDFLLVGPGGQRAMFMSDVGGSGDVSNLTVTFADGAPAPSATQLVAGTFAPTDLETGDAMAAPAPAGPYTSALSVFNGTNPNGTWNLYVVDDASSDTGSLTSFTLIMATTGSSGDYSGTTGTLSFPPGTTTQTITIPVTGDTTPEASETFFVNLSSPSNAVIGDTQGVGTIVNDDGSGPVTNADAYTTPFGTPLTVAAPGVLGNDSANGNGNGSLTAALAAPPASGSVSLQPDGAFTYTPGTGFSGVATFSYTAQASNGATSVATTVSITVGAPSGPQAPTNFYVASVTGNRVRLRWDAPVTGPTPVAYLVEGGVAPGQVLASLPVGPVPILEFDAPNGAFYVRARTVTASGTSGNSNEVPLYVNVLAPPSAPAPLLGLANGQNLALTWRNTFGGGAGTSSVVDVSGAVSASLPLGLSESFSFAGVPPGTYTFRVRTMNAAGSSAASAPVTLTFPIGCTGLPQTPTKFLAYRSGNVLSILWEAPATGAAPTSYVITATGSVNASVPTTATSLTTPVPSGTYNLSVTAVNACGASAPTAVQTVTVP